MKQGTISIICGCHSQAHSLMVFLAWKKLYGTYPNYWQTGCIILHDIGHFGKNYLDNVEEKNNHWKLGAKIAMKLYGIKGYYEVAGHVGPKINALPESRMYKADKYSWYITPYWILWWNNIIEPKIKHGMKNRDTIISFRQWVKHNIESGEYRTTHDAYLERIGELK